MQDIPLLLGSFGTLAILLFGKPEAEPVRLWPIIAGQVGATAIVMSVLQIWGANLISRAAAMAATVAWMMWSDCIHPPGGKHAVADAVLKGQLRASCDRNIAQHGTCSSLLPVRAHLLALDDPW